MATLYLTEQGSTLRKTSRRLIVEKENEVLLEVPEFKIERVLIFGNVQLTTQAIAFLLANGIETSFLSVRGRLKGKLSPLESKNVFLRVKQYEKAKDEEFRLDLSRTIVERKIKNGKTLLLRYARSHPEVDIDKSIREINRCLRALPRKERISTVMGIEGQAGAAYFKAFGKMFRKELRFERRTRRPPRDPINALLSLGYTMITNEILSMVSAIGFDPYIGFFHGISYGRPSLALDIVEEFRHPIVDTLTLNLVNNSVLKEKDFVAEKGGYFLTDEARKKYFVYYEKKLTGEFTLHNTDTKVTFRRSFDIQAHKMEKTLMEEEAYKPFAMG
ncbi:CRISPR-associated endonuclease Cas1 [candidate division WOR-3 bacterium JGI_Cruoil_03_44_89]|uniref:CRISPR-associated endonuclease Cas1 n=1 Tax=candidate division WOR-3 bacterium JGI_Cruoil_03_44_89 TaxID=1973748 RepID=A0A235BN59_UNCW3|nr:MAG: CRISPR-associated endonuclease Cas1 [candidate division WOR-3 bacterium JGI_Cruoil_03_44_89]